MLREQARRSQRKLIDLAEAVVSGHPLLPARPGQASVQAGRPNRSTRRGPSSWACSASAHAASRGSRSCRWRGPSRIRPACTPFRWVAWWRLPSLGRVCPAAPAAAYPREPLLTTGRERWDRSNGVCPLEPRGRSDARTSSAALGPQPRPDDAGSASPVREREPIGSTSPDISASSSVKWDRRVGGIPKSGIERGCVSSRRRDQRRCDRSTRSPRLRLSPRWMGSRPTQCTTSQADHDGLPFVSRSVAATTHGLRRRGPSSRSP
jgi:hypothetical protein